MSNFCVGAVVLAISGRQKNQVFVISKIEDNYAYLINGKTRKIECPNKKNFKHVQMLNSHSNLEMNHLVNCDVIKYLKDYIKSSDCK